MLPLEVRRRTSRVVGRLPLPILAGPNRGLMWSLASAGRGHWTGQAHAIRLASLLSVIRPGDRVWDVGAHHGYVTLAVARTVGPGGRVTAFEPSAMNLWFLERHVRWNRLGNVRVMPLALGDRPGRSSFGGTGGTVAFRLGRGDEIVSVATVRDLVLEEGLQTPDVVKIDTEGNEVAVLRGALDVLPDHAVLFISVHGRQRYAECRELLLASGYRLHESPEMAMRIASPWRRWGGDPELVAVGPGRDLPENVIRSLPLFSG